MCGSSDTNHTQKKNLSLYCVILFYNLPEINIYVDISSSHSYISFSATVPDDHASQKIPTDRP